MYGHRPAVAILYSIAREVNLFQSPVSSLVSQIHKTLSSKTGAGALHLAVRFLKAKEKQRCLVCWPAELKSRGAEHLAVFSPPH